MIRKKILTGFTSSIRASLVIINIEEILTQPKFAPRISKLQNITIQQLEMGFGGPLIRAYWYLALQNQTLTVSKTRVITVLKQLVLLRLCLYEYILIIYF